MKPTDDKIRYGAHVYCLGCDNHQRSGKVVFVGRDLARIERPGKYGQESWMWPIDKLRKAVA